MTHSNKVIQVAIDGPVSSGKSTVGKLVAQKLGYCMLDTGILYRAFAWKMIDLNFITKAPVSICLNNDYLEKIDKLLTSTSIRIEFKNKEAVLFVDSINVTGNLFTPEVSAVTSVVAQHPQIRSKMVFYAREAASDNNIIMVGRDVGTVILPDAALKIYLDASSKERALRRFKEYQDRGIDITFEKVHNDLISRDNNDTTREHSPLTLAKDAIKIDTTNMEIKEVVEDIVVLVNNTVTSCSS